jgi:glutathione S-transferase
MYTLIGSPKSRGFRVMWMLEEAGQEYEIIAAAAGSEEARNYNPSGKIPALVVDDKVIIDSMAICQFIADRHKVCTYEAGTIERARQDSWLHFGLDELDSACWWAAKHTFVLPEEYRSSDALKACEYDFSRALGWLEERLGGNDYVMGDKFTVPDLLIVHCFGWAIGMHKWQVPEGPLTAYMNRVRGRPAFQKAWAAREAS